MSIRRKLERLESRAGGAVCSTCKNKGGRRILIAWPGDPLDLGKATACPRCGRCPPRDQVKIIDVSDVLNLGYNPYELLVAKYRLTGGLTDTEREQFDDLERQYASVSSLKRVGV